MIDFVKDITLEESKNLAIPTDRLRFNEYREPALNQDVVQIFFREKVLDKGVTDKFSFEVLQS